MSEFGHLRVVKAELLTEYLRNNELYNAIGSRAFAELVQSQPDSIDRIDPELLSGDGADVTFQKPYVLYHSWVPGFIEVSEAHAQEALALARGEEMPGSKLARSLRSLGWASGGGVDLDMLVEQSLSAFRAIQNPHELTEFFRLVEGKRPRVVVEIGTARGGVLFGLSQLADPSALIISIDLPGGSNCGGQTRRERELFSTFGPSSQEFQFIPMNSRFWSARARLEQILAGRPIDLLFIDGDHSYGGVRSDFEMYHPFVAPDGLVALHDICLLPEEWGDGNEVGAYWREIRDRFRTVEIIDAAGSTRRDKAPDVRYAWGIGVILDHTRA